MSATTMNHSKVALDDLAQEEVRALLTGQLPANIYFHNENYLDQVLKAVGKLTAEAQLEAPDGEALRLAAIFNSLRYMEGKEKPWQKSAKAATEFLLRNNAPSATVERVEKLLLATNPKHKPETLPEKLFLDALNSYYGDKKLLQRADRLRKEEEETGKLELDEIEWTSSFIERVREHAFHTSQAESLFAKRKEKNIQKLTKGLKSDMKVRLEGDKSSSISANSGARTMFKTALRNHIDLTNIADSKANLMLSVNAMIVTIGLPAFSKYLAGTSYLIVPGVVFLLTSVASMIIATLSTRPVKVDGHTDLTQLKSGKTNLFFFGNFYKMQNEEYQEAIKQVVADRENLDSSFVNDLFYLGIALGEKFRLLRLCYNVFVIGLCLSVLSFVVTYLVAMP
jgi:hypothetical protein